MHTMVRTPFNLFELELINVLEDESAISDDTPTSPVPFSCPTVFDLDQEVEIDNSVFVTCDELKPFYEIPVLDV